MQKFLSVLPRHLALASLQCLAAAPALAAETHTNSIGMEFVKISAGTFQMGCSSFREACAAEEKPRHEVRISRPFFLGKYEVTRAQWVAVMGAATNRAGSADHPWEGSWNEAQDFIAKLNAREGHKRYRLPTEAEWEYAAHAGSTAAYAFGDDAKGLDNFGWHAGNAGAAPHPVGEKRPGTTRGHGLQETF